MYAGAAARDVVAHVLTLDDDPAVRQLITAYLSDYDLRVTPVSRECEMSTVLAREAVEFFFQFMLVGHASIKYGERPFVPRPARRKLHRESLSTRHRRA